MACGERRSGKLTGLCALLLTATACASPAHAATVEITTGKYANTVEIIKGKMSRVDGQTFLVVGVKNVGTKELEGVLFECGYYNGNELVASSTSGFENILPGQTAFGTTGSGDETPVTRVVCRVSDVVEKSM
jgi:hypothetical protein